MRSLVALSLTVAFLATSAALLAPPLQAQSLTTLVSNTHLSSLSSGTAFQAQSFETGANAGGYTVSEVDIRLGNVSGRGTKAELVAETLTGSTWTIAESEAAIRPRNLAGNPDSPQAVIFLTSITDVMMGS